MVEDGTIICKQKGYKSSIQPIFYAKRTTIPGKAKETTFDAADEPVWPLFPDPPLLLPPLAPLGPQEEHCALAKLTYFPQGVKEQHAYLILIAKK